MCGPISVVFADIYLCKMEDDTVAATKPIFYKQYVDDTYVRRKNNTKDELFEKLNRDIIPLFQLKFTHGLKSSPFFRVVRFY